MASVVQVSSSASSLFSAVAFPQHQQQRRGAARSVGLIRVRAESAATSSVAINPSIKKEVDKVVDTVALGELQKPLTAYCRSGTFPLCDGAHAKHNKATGDNVGPLLLKK